MTDKTRKNKNPFGDALLGETLTQFQLDSLEDVQLAAQALASQSRRSIKIFSPDLEQAVYHNARFAKTIANVAQLHRSTFVQILIQDPIPALKCGHLLVEEAQRLSSSVQIRRVNRDDASQTKSILLVDDVGLLLRKNWATYDGVLMFHGGVDAIKQLRFFTRAWEAGEPEVEFRRLGM